MDQFGNLFLSSCAGYNGYEIAFLNDDTLCYVVGNSLKFVSIQKNETKYLQSIGDGILSFAVNPEHQCVAFSDNGLENQIFVYDIEKLEEPKVVLPGSSLGFSCLAFSHNGNLLAGCATIPDVTLIIWNWLESMQLCSMEIETPLEKLSFNPMNWQYLCGINNEQFYVWDVQHINNHYWLNQLDIRFPYEDGTYGLEDTDIYSDQEENGNRLLAQTFCWLPENCIFTYFKNSSFVAVVNVESQSVRLLQKGLNSTTDLKQLKSSTVSKEGVYCGLQDGRLLSVAIKDTCYEVIDLNVECSASISSLAFSTDFQKLIIGTDNGCIYVHDKHDSLKPLVENEFGKIVGVGCLSDGNQYFVTCRSFGLLQIWSLKHCNIIGTLQLKNYKIECLVIPASSDCVFVGTEHGSIIVIDVSKPSTPRFIDEIFLHKAPISLLVMDEAGMLLISGSSDGHVFILNGKVSTHLCVLGYTDMTGHILCGSIKKMRENVMDGPWKVLIGISSSDEKTVCNQMMELTITQELIAGTISLYMDQTKLLKDVSINKRIFLLKSSIYDIVITSKETAFAITHQQKKIAKFLLDEKETSHTNMVIEASSVFQGHIFYGGKISLSNHGKWLLSVSPDGRICVRAIGAMGNSVTQLVANYRNGGLTQAIFSNDGQSIICVSNDGCITCWQWQFTALGKSKASSAIDAYRSLSMSVKKIKDTENEYVCQMKTVDQNKEVTVESTYLEQAVENQHKEEDKQFAISKSQLRNDIESLRSKVLAMIATNETLPDIEKLEKQQFNMDLEERQNLIKEREKTLRKLRAEVELENTAKRFTHHLIQQDCWDEMEVKGKSVYSINGTSSVSNYPLKKVSNEEENQFQFVMQQRKLENVEKDIKEKILQSEASSNKSLLETLASNDGDDESSQETNRDEHQLNGATYGSLGFKYGGYNPMLYNQFILRTKIQKNYQKTMIQRCIRQIKESFNKTFEGVFANKINEVRRINERNIRIRKILHDMDVTDISVEDIELCAGEQPESFLTIRDGEVKVEKYISEEERKRIEEERLLEEQRRLENTDDIRSRALDMMMAGRLETNLEEELKKDIEQPEFMKEKQQSDWNEEEVKKAKEYEKKMTQLQEDREKYRKSLEGELKKLQAANVDAASSFDEKVQELFQLKIRTEAVILQEELKIVRISASILNDEELESKENNLLTKLELLKEKKQNSSLAVGEAKREVEAFRDEYETLFADDKTLDKTFRREFPELDAHTVDTLYRLFKKRPRAQRTLKAAAESQADFTTASDRNPFKIRPSSSRAANAAAHVLEKAMLELDSDEHMPEHVEEDTWRKLIWLRRNKVEREQQLKTKALVLADLTTHFQKQVDNDEDLKASIERTFEEMQRVREERLRTSLDLEVQLLVKQGQLEVENGDFIPNYENALLLHRSAVEDLNSAILTLGKAKLASMYESKDFRKGIHQLEWELKEMFMRAEDSETMAQDLQLLRVTKELQVYLSDTDQRESKQQEIGSLEKRIESYKQMQQRKLNDKRRCLRKLRQKIRQRTDENNELDIKLEDLSLSLAERQSVENALDHDDGSSEAERMKDIITRRKLVDIAKVQSSELGLLRAEVERLRMRTFPALLQLDYS